MNYFIKQYYNLLLKLESYKKNLVSKKTKLNNGLDIYSKYLDEIDNLLLEKYIKIEEILNEFNEQNY
mgnify:CR=1 FL=1